MTKWILQKRTVSSEGIVSIWFVSRDEDGLPEVMDDQEDAEAIATSRDNYFVDCCEWRAEPWEDKL